MRLQSAVFHLEDTLIEGDGAPEGAQEVLSILKMEGVWMAAVTSLSREKAGAVLQKCGLSDYFRLILSQEEALVDVCSTEMLEKAMRRLHSQKADTVVFCGTLQQIAAAKRAGLRTAVVKAEQPIAEMADYAFSGYRDLLE